MAEAEDLKSSQCGFDPHSGHHLVLNEDSSVLEECSRSIGLFQIYDWIVTNYLLKSFS
jgi:hypothetical protein